MEEELDIYAHPDDPRKTKLEYRTKWELKYSSWVASKLECLIISQYGKALKRGRQMDQRFINQVVIFDDYFLHVSDTLIDNADLFFMTFRCFKMSPSSLFNLWGRYLFGWIQCAFCWFPTHKKKGEIFVGKVILYTHQSPIMCFQFLTVSKF